MQQKLQKVQDQDLKLQGLSMHATCKALDCLSMHPFAWLELATSVVLALRKSFISFFFIHIYIHMNGHTLTYNPS